MRQNKKARARALLRWLKKTYTRTPDAFVRWSTPLELVVATVLSAQCTDKKVNEVTRMLFQKYKTAKIYARAKLSELERDIYSTGFYRQKAKSLKGIGRALVRRYNGKVPGTLDELLTLPGVGRKSAYLVLAKAFGKNVGIAVDTHVFRRARELGLSQAKTREKMSDELSKLFNPKDYLDVNEYLILHGRAMQRKRM